MNSVIESNLNVNLAERILDMPSNQRDIFCTQLSECANRADVLSKRLVVGEDLCGDDLMEWRELIRELEDLRKEVQNAFPLVYQTRNYQKHM